MNTVATPATQRQFPCKSCGANLIFAPGTDALKCPYCGVTNEIPEATEIVEELDYATHLRDCVPPEEMGEVLTVRCQTCGAETTLAQNVTAQRCPFCGAGIVAQAASQRKIKPKSLLPFRITQQQAAESFRRWIYGLWFAPSELKKRAERSQIDGVYVPCWTYDADTVTRYTGERGEDYWVTETYTAYQNGKPVTRTRQVRKTRWWPVSGVVRNTFDDVLVLAERTLPRKCAEALEPWDLNALVPYRDEYLSGFVAESYQIGLADGFVLAQGLMAPHIHRTICQDIGGDHQRVHSADTKYYNVTFKHALLPIWISAYRYADKTYRFLVNARTGEVQGERPYSWIKITLAVLAALIVVAIVLLIAQGR